MNRQIGFTLIEIMVAVTIVAVLTAAGMVSYSSATKRSRDAKRKSDIEQIRQALEMYRADNGYYPARNGAGWIDVTLNLFSQDLVSKYISTMPTDPKSPAQTYWYKATNPVVNTYYGYCLSALVEGVGSVDVGCFYPGPPVQNYGVKNP